VSELVEYCDGRLEIKTDEHMDVHLIFYLRMLNKEATNIILRNHKRLLRSISNTQKSFRGSYTEIGLSESSNNKHSKRSLSRHPIS
jgi:hypothetical protein